MPKSTTHGGARPGAGRKPTLRPLHVVRLLDPAVREALAALTAHERQVSGNAHLSQEQVVAQLILAAHTQAPPPIDFQDNQEHLAAAAP